MHLLINQSASNLQNDQEKQCLMEALQGTVDEQSAEIAAKSTTIDELHQQIARIDAEMKVACGDFLFNCRDLRKDEYMAILDVLQAEKECLLGQVAEMNNRVTKERERNAELLESMRRQSVKHNRLEFKYSECWMLVYFQILLQSYILDECIKEQSTLKDRYRRTLRIAEYAKHVNSSVSTMSINSSSSSVTSFATNAPTTDDQFQLNLYCSELKNK